MSSCPQISLRQDSSSIVNSLLLCSVCFFGVPIVGIDVKQDALFFDLNEIPCHLVICYHMILSIGLLLANPSEVFFYLSEEENCTFVLHPRS